MDISTWDQCYVAGDMPWNKEAPSPPLVDWVRRHTGLKGKALVPGCGLGHDAAMLADAGLQVTGIDIAPTAIRMARQKYPRHAECFVLADLFALPQSWLGTFDFVFEHTCLSALPPGLRPAYRDAVAAALKSGGLLAGVWYLNPDLDPGESGPPFALPEPELTALFAKDFDVVEDAVPPMAFPGREGRERLRVLRRLP